MMLIKVLNKNNSLNSQINRNNYNYTKINLRNILI